MDRLRSFRQIAWLCVIILFAQLGLLALMLPSPPTFVWIALVVVAVLGAYLGRIALLMIREVERSLEREQQSKK